MSRTEQGTADAAESTATAVANEEYQHEEAASRSVNESVQVTTQAAMQASVKELVNGTMNETNSSSNGSRMLFRSPTEKMIAGVCGGLADYLGWDPVLVRIAWIVITLSTGGGGFLAYLALGLLLPVGTAAQGQQRPAAIELNERNLSRVAYVLIGLGGLWLLANMGILSSLWGGFWAVTSIFFWPAVLVIVGYTLLSKRDKENWRESFDGMTSRVRNNTNGVNSADFKTSLSSARARLPLKRSRNDRIFLGVCGGISQRTGLDANLVRLLWVPFGIATFGVAVAVYVAAGILLPEEPVAAPFVEPQDVQVVEGTAETVV